MKRLAIILSVIGVAYVGGHAAMPPTTSGSKLVPGPNPACPAPWKWGNGTDACPQCCEWADVGQCDANPTWMLPYCQFACGSFGCQVGADKCKQEGVLIKLADCKAGPEKAKTPEGPAGQSGTQTITINLILQAQAQSPGASTMSTTAAATTTAAPSMGMGGTLLLIPLNLGGAGGGAAGGTTAATTTTTTAKPPTINTANVPIYVISLANVPGAGTAGGVAPAAATTTTANPLAGINIDAILKAIASNSQIAAAGGTTTTTAKPAVAGLAGLSPGGTIPIIILTPQQRARQARRRAVAMARRKNQKKE